MLFYMFVAGSLIFVLFGAWSYRLMHSTTPNTDADIVAPYVGFFAAALGLLLAKNALMADAKAVDFGSFVASMLGTVAIISNVGGWTFLLLSARSWLSARRTAASLESNIDA